MAFSCLVMLCVLGVPSEARAVAKGVVDNRLNASPADPAMVKDLVADMGRGSLGARWTRIAVSWPRLQPNAPAASDPSYDAAYVAQLKSTTAQLEAAGINVILTPYLTPRWASNSKLWQSPQVGYPKGVYEPFYAMNTGSASVMNAYQAMCTFLAKTLGPAPYGVRHYECYNEPNLGTYLYPQWLGGNTDFGASTYLKMLHRFYRGIKAANRSNVVIGGATGPFGWNEPGSTSPQRFADYLKRHGGAKWFDTYSHHPYQIGGSASPAPTSPPYNPRLAVTLSNIGQLLRVFPKKPFYLTEYGYTTESMPQWPVPVTQVQQAQYLRTAYSMAAKHRQIKVLLWFGLRDTSAGFTALEKSNGVHKLSWSAFARLK